MAPGPIPRPDSQGWFPDPSGRHELRWFNGAKWTTAVMDDGVESRHDPREPDPPAVESEVPAAADADAGAWETSALRTTSSPRGRRAASSSWWSQRSAGAKGALVVGAILVVLLAFSAVVRNQESSEGPREIAETTTTRERVTTTTEAATTVPSTTTTTLPPPTTAPPPPPTAAAPQTQAAPPPQAQNAPPPSPSCNSNYSGCVQVASDVDCAGGSGDGPAYVNGPVQIVGSDVYDLDSDGDGIGCE